MGVSQGPPDLRSSHDYLGCEVREGQSFHVGGPWFLGCQNPQSSSGSVTSSGKVSGCGKEVMVHTPALGTIFFHFVHVSNSQTQVCRWPLSHLSL